MEILGVGPAELIMIALFMLIVAGPKRSALWARQAGLYMRQLRGYWQKMMQELRQELGDDADEIVRTAQELRRSASEITNAPRTAVREAVSLAEKAAAKQEIPNNGAAPKPEESENRYSAWTKD